MEIPTLTREKQLSSTPYYPQSNSIAENAVKSVKHLLSKIGHHDLDTDVFWQGLLEYRNTPRPDGRSPQIVYGHPLRSHVPAHWKTFSPEWQRKAEEADLITDEIQEKAKEYYNLHAKLLKPFCIGDLVCVQDVNTKRWTH